MTTLVYKYGCLPPVENADVLQEQLRLAADYHRSLVELENKRRSERSAAMTQHSLSISRLEGEIEALTADIDAACDELKRERAKERKRGVKSNLPSKVKELKEARKSKRSEMKAERAAIRDSQKEANEYLSAGIEKYCNDRGSSSKKDLTDGFLRAGPRTLESAKNEVLEEMLTDERWPVLWREERRIDHEALVEQKRLRAASGIAHGTYVAVEEAVNDAREDSFGQLRRPMWDGGGSVGVQLSTPVIDLAAPSTKFQLLDERVPSRPGRHTNHKNPPPTNLKKRSMTARVRIQSDDKGDPVWCTLPVRVHRPLPVGAAITWAYVVVKRIGARWKYELQLTINAEVERRKGNGCVALDLGWRKMGDTLRVGFAIDERGEKREIQLPIGMVDSYHHIESLRSIGDKHCDTAKHVLLRFLKSINDKLSEEQRVKFTTIAHWKSRKKLARAAFELSELVSTKGQLMETWAAQKGNDLLPVPDDIGDNSLNLQARWIFCWAKKDRHLYQWECDRRERWLNRRKDFYRNIAAELAKKYETLVLEKWDLRYHAEKSAAESATSDAGSEPRANRFIAAISEFRIALSNAFGSDRLVKKNPAYTTAHHWRCGKDMEGEPATQLILWCHECGSHIDQDENAARNLLKMHVDGCEQLGSSPSSGSARTNKAAE
jgi:hypothetical protein